MADSRSLNRYNRVRAITLEAGLGEDLVLAAQFESWVHPFMIMLTVPLAMAGVLLGLWLTGQPLHIYARSASSYWWGWRPRTAS